MIVRKDLRNNFWKFMQPISWEIGVVYLATVFVIGILVWIFEETNWKRPCKEHFLNL